MVNGQLFCRNSTCPAQSSKMLENFCKKMKIKGFGAKTIEKLELVSIYDLYSLDRQTVAEAIGDKMAMKLMDELDKACTCEFAMFLGSLGIPLIGTVAAKKVAEKCNSFAEITRDSCKDAGLGDKATESLLDFINSDTGDEIMDTVDMYIAFTEPKKAATVTTCNAQIDVCITGKLNDFKNRNDAADYLLQYGITVKKSVTKSTQYLICEDETKVGSSSYKKAETNGIEITSIKNLINSLENK